MKRIAVIYDRADAKALGDAGSVDSILAMTPDARGSIPDVSDRVLTSADLFGRFGHARALVWRRRLHRVVGAKKNEFGRHTNILSNYVLGMLDQNVSFAARTHETFRNLAADVLLLVRARDGQWHEFDKRAAAADAFVEKLAGMPVSEPGQTSPVFPWLYQFLVEIVIRTIAKKGPWCVCTRTGLPFGLDQALYDSPQQLRRLVINISIDNKSYGRLFREMVRFLRASSPLFQIDIPMAPNRSAEAIVGASLTTMKGTILPVVLKVCQEAVCRTSGDIVGSVDSLKSILSILKPKASVSYQTSSTAEHILSAAAAEAGIDRIVLNYNSHTRSTGACSVFSNHGHYRLKVWNALADRVLTWSPNGVELIESLRQPADDRKVTAVRSMPPIAYDVAREGLTMSETPIVLHAGSFLSWDRTLLWCLETSDEYADSILSFATVAANVESIHAVARCKKKGEAGGEAIARLLPRNSPVSLQGLERPFKEVLLETTLLVSFMSTVIEEALAARTPVLLWGPTDRYLHLSPRWQPPTGPGDRAAVYAASDEPALAEMLRSIVAAHNGSPLTDAEIAPYIFDENVPGLEAIPDWIEEGNFPDWHGVKAKASG